jgi:primosomal protein N'
LPGRYADAGLPDVALVDLRRHAPARGGFLSPVLLKAMAKRWKGRSNRSCFSIGAAMRR